MIASRTRSSSPATGAAANAWRVEVFRRADLSDPDGEHLLAALTEIGVGGVVRARAGKGYLLPGTLARADVDRVCRELLADPVLDEARITAPGESPATPSRGAQRILVSKKPGVMDPVALTVARALRRIGLVAEDSIPVATFQAWELEGTARLARAMLEHIGREILSNEVIEDLHLDDDALKIALPPASPRHGVVHVALGAADDERLLAISRDGALSLSLVEMRAIRDHYAAQGREPTIAELETIAQT